METRIVTIPFDPETELFEDEAFRNFTMNKKLKRIRPEFFQADDKAYWTVFVEYEPVLDDLPLGRKRPAMSEPQKMLFDKLRIWRKERAEQEGIPVFIIATNRELTDVVVKVPQSMEALKSIKGFGKKKIERHGKEILDIVRAFHTANPAQGKDGGGTKP